jgi:hypothetical protein
MMRSFVRRAWKVLTKYAVDSIVGENTWNVVTDFVYRELDHVRVVGKD